MHWDNISFCLSGTKLSPATAQRLVRTRLQHESQGAAELLLFLSDRCWRVLFCLWRWNVKKMTMLPLKFTQLRLWVVDFLTWGKHLTIRRSTNYPFCQSVKTEVLLIWFFTGKHQAPWCLFLWIFLFPRLWVMFSSWNTKSEPFFLR